MPTRISRPAVWRPLALSLALVGFQAYLGYSAIGGQFGTESQKTMQAQIEDLSARSARLQVEIDAYKHRAALFASDSLDPDILTEQARALLNMAHPEDVIIMLGDHGLPISGSSADLTENQLPLILATNPAL
jgi:cell division protein FtsB